MTWDHPRAWRPFEAFAKYDNDAPHVDWARQSLADFEAKPLSELSRDYDLIVLDHPNLGRAIEEGVLLPLEDLFERSQLDAWAGDMLAPTWLSYACGGSQWALPIDASTQMSVRAAEVTKPTPMRWNDMHAFVSQTPTALCLGGPHALLGLLALAHNTIASKAAPLLSPEVGSGALELFQRLWAVVDREASLLDPIEIHELIATEGGPQYCPLVYGYASYARPAAGRRQLAWGNAPCWNGYVPKSVLGGTGLAVSAASSAPEQAREYIERFMRKHVQCVEVPNAGGQPAHVDAWTSQETDAAWGGFYSSGRQSVESAWTRPRNPGWIRVQAEASSYVRDAVRSGSAPEPTVAKVNALYAEITDEGSCEDE